jgi:hypothetical protein
MDSEDFAKFAKEYDLINKNCSPTDVDLIFSKVKNKFARKIILS